MNIKNIKKHGHTIAMGSMCVLTVIQLYSASPVQAAAPDTTVPIGIQYMDSRYVHSLNWEPAVKTGINNFLDMYGNRSPSYNPHAHPYAVFDFDNTTSIMDVEEQCMIWQLNHLAFAITPDNITTVLQTGIPADKLAMTYGADDGNGRPVRISDAIADASAAYGILCKKGLVSVRGHELSADTKNSAEFKEFTAKMRWLYDAIGETMDASVSYPWVTYWFTGMTPAQVYQLAYDCDSYYGDPFKGQTWSKGTYQSPASADNLAGTVRVSYKLGITVTPEIRELYGTFQRNGIDNWICSASPVDVVRAAVDYFKVPGVKGIVAMTNKTANGVYINAYNYDYHAQTQGPGKSQAISKVIVPQYNGNGPSFCAMDSQGDFNFCTEFKNTKEVLVLNRQRKDDAALCAAIAIWQQQNHTDLAKANGTGNTLFLLQGRNENKGTLWSDNQTLLLGKTEKVFLSEKAKKALDQLQQGQSIKKVLQTNTKLKNYDGYKTK